MGADRQGNVHGPEVHMIHRRALSFLRNLFARDRAERRLDTEMEGFVEMLAADYRARGLSLAEAARR